MILTGGSLEESKLAYQHAAAYGQHPPSRLLDRWLWTQARRCAHSMMLCLDICYAPRSGLYSTVGLHPTRTHEMDADPQSYLSQLDGVIAGGLAHKKGKGRVVAIGECGLGETRTPITSFQ